MANENVTPSAAALSGPMLSLLLVSFVLNAGSGIGLWIWPEHSWRVFHGWTIPPFLITLGVIWRVHILRGWRIRKNRLSGVITLTVFLLLTISGWAIYYSGSDKIQESMSKAHIWLGLAVSFIFLVHAVLGLRSREVPKEEFEI
jgi:hypothetical protein